MCFDQAQKRCQRWFLTRQIERCQTDGVALREDCFSRLLQRRSPPLLRLRVSSRLASSWKRMLVVQPPVALVIIWDHRIAPDYDDCFVEFARNANGVRMGELLQLEEEQWMEEMLKRCWDQLQPAQQAGLMPVPTQSLDAVLKSEPSVAVQEVVSDG